jgi:manganese/iron transport system ATP-binding protein
MGTGAVELHGVSAGYDGGVVLQDVDLAIGAGELVALVGGNGAGKSTLLKLVAGLLRPKRGSVEVLGALPGARSREVAYLPQAEALRWDYPLLVADVVLMGLVPRIGVGRRPGRADHVAARAALARVDAADLGPRHIQALSGGQRQRVLLARTLVADPQILLLDEPATGVDPTTEEQLMRVLEDLAREGKTIVVATHDLAGVLAHFPRVVSLNGRIVADGGVALLRDERILRETYGGHRPADPLLLGDDHHA